jgi:hypothetical protein
VKSDRTGQMSDSNRRITTQADFGLTDLGIIAGNHEIAHHRQLGTPTECVSVDGCDTDAVGLSDPQNETVELFKDNLYFPWGMVGNIHTRGESTIPCSRNHDDLRLQVLYFRPGTIELIQHLKIDDV